MTSASGVVLLINEGVEGMLGSRGISTVVKFLSRGSDVEFATGKIVESFWASAEVNRTERSATVREDEIMIAGMFCLTVEWNARNLLASPPFYTSLLATRLHILLEARGIGTTVAVSCSRLYNLQLSLTL